MLASWLVFLVPPRITYMIPLTSTVTTFVIPEASSGQHSNLSTIGFAVGFVLMMVLDVVMG